MQAGLAIGFVHLSLSLSVIKKRTIVQTAYNSSVIALHMKLLFDVLTVLHTKWHNYSRLDGSISVQHYVNRMIV